MSNIDKDLITWVINKIETEYKGEISLLLGRKGACKIPTDGDDMAFEFFIPSSEHGYSLARTFIIDDMGYDLFPMSWERVEGLAALDEGISFCLADSEILYARNEADRERFEILRKKLFNNLKNEEYVYKKCLERINSAMDIYKTMMFENSIGQVRKASGAIVDNLCEAVLMINGTYSNKDYGYLEKIDQMTTLKKVPANFSKNYESILRAKNVKNLYEIVHNFISEARDFFKNFAPKKVIKGYNYDELAGWYEESRYTFRRIEYACKNKKYADSFALGCYLQIELDILTEEAGLNKMDLLEAYNSEDLSSFKEASMKIEKYIIKEINKHGVVLKKYDNIEQFFKYQK